MGICVLFKSCLVMRKKVLHSQIACICSFVWQNLPSDYFLWRISTIFANVFVLGKERLCQNFSLMKGKKKSPKKEFKVLKIRQKL
jgi:hypothetical protein